jgi:AcrR family transcriptional regulator
MAVTPLGLRTRDALLSSGRAVAERDGLAALSVSAVVKEAGVAKGTFYVHFTDREAFVAALREDARQRIAERVSEQVADLEPGIERLLAGLTAYLDACLANRTVEAVIQEVRDDTSGRASVSALVQANLRAAAWRDPQSAARLVVAMAVEVALVEHEAGGKLHGLRRWLRRFVERGASA